MLSAVIVGEREHVRAAMEIGRCRRPVGRDTLGEQDDEQGERNAGQAPIPCPHSIHGRLPTPAGKDRVPASSFQMEISVERGPRLRGRMT
jgi:hypothetical protein